jgi:uncharacterized membrane protein YgcG
MKVFPLFDGSFVRDRTNDVIHLVDVLAQPGPQRDSDAAAERGMLAIDLAESLDSARGNNRLHDLFMLLNCGCGEFQTQVEDYPLSPPTGPPPRWRAGVLQGTQKGGDSSESPAGVGTGAGGGSGGGGGR